MRFSFGGFINNHDICTAFKNTEVWRSPVSASGLGPEGRGFESLHLDRRKEVSQHYLPFFFFIRFQNEKVSFKRIFNSKITTTWKSASKLIYSNAKCWAFYADFCRSLACCSDSWAQKTTCQDGTKASAPHITPHQKSA